MGKGRRARSKQPGRMPGTGGGQGTARKVRKGSERLWGQKTQGPIAHSENWGSVPEAMGNLSND